MLCFIFSFLVYCNESVKMRKWPVPTWNKTGNANLEIPLTWCQTEQPMETFLNQDMMMNSLRDERTKTKPWLNIIVNEREE